jgi:hypothetical protein
VDAFKAFMEKGVAPFFPEDHSVVNEWKFLSTMLSADPVDYSQIDFYLMMTNKSSSPYQSSVANNTYTQPQSTNTETNNFAHLTNSQYSPVIKKSGMGNGVTNRRYQLS